MQPTTRTRRAFTTHHVTRRTAEIECLHCSATHTVDRDEDGGPDVDFVPCQGSDTCEAMLCQGCRRQCDFCGLYACDDHIKGKVCLTCREQEAEEAAIFWDGGEAA